MGRRFRIPSDLALATLCLAIAGALALFGR